MRRLLALWIGVSSVAGDGVDPEYWFFDVATFYVDSTPPPTTFYDTDFFDVTFFDSNNIYQANTQVFFDFYDFADYFGFPTMRPTRFPTQYPTEYPSASPSVTPTISPTNAPSVGPTDSPTLRPTSRPSWSPTPYPTPFPTPSPTPGPTRKPTGAPTAVPTDSPTAAPSPYPTVHPTFFTPYAYHATVGACIIGEQLTVNDEDTTPEECAHKCFSQLDYCYSFDWHPLTKSCEYKRVDQRRAPSEYYWSPPDCSEEQVHYSKMDVRGYRQLLKTCKGGNNLNNGNFVGVTLLQCQAECDARQRCQAFNFDMSSGTCQLKRKQITDSEPNTCQHSITQVYYEKNFRRVGKGQCSCKAQIPNEQGEHTFNRYFLSGTGCQERCYESPKCIGYDELEGVLNGRLYCNIYMLEIMSGSNWDDFFQTSNGCVNAGPSLADFTSTEEAGTSLVEVAEEENLYAKRTAFFDALINQVVGESAGAEADFFSDFFFDFFTDNIRSKETNLTTSFFADSAYFFFDFEYVFFDVGRFEMGGGPTDGEDGGPTVFFEDRELHFFDFEFFFTDHEQFFYDDEHFFVDFTDFHYFFNDAEALEFVDSFTFFYDFATFWTEHPTSAPSPQPSDSPTATPTSKPTSAPSPLPTAADFYTCYMKAIDDPPQFTGYSIPYPYNNCLLRYDLNRYSGTTAAQCRSLCDAQNDCTGFNWRNKDSGANCITKMVHKQDAPAVDWVWCGTGFNDGWIHYNRDYKFKPVGVGRCGCKNTIEDGPGMGIHSFYYSNSSTCMEDCALNPYCSAFDEGPSGCNLFYGTEVADMGTLSPTINCRFEFHSRGDTAVLRASWQEFPPGFQCYEKVMPPPPEAWSEVNPLSELMVPEGFCIEGFDLQLFSTSDIWNCANYCRQDPLCKSFNYAQPLTETERDNCVLKSVDTTDEPGSFVFCGASSRANNYKYLPVRTTQDANGTVTVDSCYVSVSHPATSCGVRKQPGTAWEGNSTACNLKVQSLHKLGPSDPTNLQSTTAVPAFECRTQTINDLPTACDGMCYLV